MKDVSKIIEVLDKLYPEPRCTLDYENSLQLLIATQLAAQCTDARVNLVTKKLFKKYKSVEEYANSNIEELKEDIKSTGFYNHKAENIKATAKIIIDKFGGEVPPNMEDLLELPGVGRKTANVVLGEIFNIPGIVVDTHAGRISRRLGLTKNKDPYKVELDLMKVIPQEVWNRFCHQLVFHGRQVCISRKPLCEQCELKLYCSYYKEKRD